MPRSPFHQTDSNTNFPHVTIPSPMPNSPPGTAYTVHSHAHLPSSSGCHQDHPRATTPTPSIYHLLLRWTGTSEGTLRLYCNRTIHTPPIDSFLRGTRVDWCWRPSPGLVAEVWVPDYNQEGVVECELGGGGRRGYTKILWGPIWVGNRW